MWSGAINQIPEGWALCNGQNGTPDLRDKFIMGAGNTYANGATGGETTHVLTVNEMPSHNHGRFTGTESQDHSHQAFHDAGRNFSIPAGSDHQPMFGQEHGLNANTNNASNSHYHEIPAQGGGAAQNNISPFYALAFIVKL